MEDREIALYEYMVRFFPQFEHLAIDYNRKVEDTDPEGPELSIFTYFALVFQFNST